MGVDLLGSNQSGNVGTRLMVGMLGSPRDGMWEFPKVGTSAKLVDYSLNAVASQGLFSLVIGVIVGVVGLVSSMCWIMGLLFLFLEKGLEVVLAHDSWWGLVVFPRSLDFHVIVPN